MEHGDNKWPASRIVHLVGGCRAINNQGQVVQFDPHTLEGKQAQFQINQYGAIFQSLESLGFGVIGVDFYSHVLEAKGSVLPDWRSYHRTSHTSWPTEEVAQKWRNIGHAAFKQKNGKLWDIASRIGYQLRVCDWRLREISEAYRNQLFARIQLNSFKVGHQIEDGFSWLSYLSIQSFLVDACILRDYLSEFMSDFIYSGTVELVNLRITAMGAFKRKVLNKITQTDGFTQELMHATSNGGWLTLLGNYRNMVVHSAPLAQAERKLFSVCNELKIIGGGSIPIIVCPIPENPAEILNSRSTGSHFEDFEKQFNVFVEAAK
ncbi:MAG TPA: hypothetical protein PKJ63_13305, partial [Cyclobacteriaceae bacterium]|nr:hypothetical protein [Cyclobacteriaceae bacterium]